MSHTSVFATNKRQVGSHSQTLSSPAGNPQAGKGAGADSEGNGIKLDNANPGSNQQLTDKRQQGFGMRLADRAGTLKQGTIVPERTSTEFGGCF